MTALGLRIAARIAASGPISVADYMAECLLNPQLGYYATRDPFGRAGDFTTAPEISQMFGELLGLCLAQCWLDQGSPTPFALAEPGPGRGTLMADALRVAARIPGFRAGAQVWLVEASAHLRAVQRHTLGAIPANWIASTSDLPALPLFLIANEFFDALPVRQFVRDGAGWRERMVTRGRTDGLAFALGPALPVAALAGRMEDTRDGDLVEIRPSAAPVMQEIASRIAAHGGAALVFDYGGWRSLGDTLQAVRGHACEDPLANPGEADLTAHVDFEALALAAPALRASPMLGQGCVLKRLGIDERAAVLARNLAGDALASHLAAHHRLTSTHEMGTLFQTIAFTPPAAPPPAGYHAA